LEDKNNNEKITEDYGVETKVPYLTQNDVRNTVTSFVLAWLKGDVTIDFPDARQIVLIEKNRGINKSPDEAFKIELNNKKQFRETISVFTGNTPATDKQKEEAMSELFKRIIDFRCGDRIKGTFGKQDSFEARISALEEQMTAINQLFQELVITVRSHKHAN
jgi:hypothetical protein